MKGNRNTLMNRLFGVTLSVVKLICDVAYKSKVFPFERIHNPENNEEILLKRIRKKSIGTLICSSSALILVSFAKQLECIPVICNSVDSIYKILERQGITMLHWWENVFTSIPFLGVAPYMVLVPVFFATAFILFSEDTMFLLWLLPETFRHHWVTYGILLFSELYISFLTMTSACFTMVICWSYFISILGWLSFLGVTGDQNLHQFKGTINFSKKLFVYRCISIMTVYYNELTLVLDSSMVFGISCMTTICLFVSIAGRKVLPFEMYVVFPVFSVVFFFVIIVTYTQLGQIRNLSTKLLITWEYQLASESYKSMSRKHASYQSKDDHKNRQALKGLHWVGVKLFTTNLSLTTPKIMIESIMTFFIILIEYKMH
ncbi:unnamed protein product [Allacma fusca]|uniref:Uncharacterized protein n=1 Tax=Allacma fusca TaxID=39272 RepID=A0A8J2P654_9HEXA|nr:unnamed protein product [Allacma fusca]